MQSNDDDEKSLKNASFQKMKSIMKTSETQSATELDLVKEDCEI